MAYWLTFKETISYDNTKKMSEKYQWLKLYDRNPIYTIYVDKYTVRTYVAEVIGREYLIPLIGVYCSVDEIPWESLPNKFVLKCTHGSSSNIICHDKSILKIEKASRQLRKWMRRNWFWYGREWPYKNVEPRIICEKLLVDESGYELKDYKIFCFHGEPKLIQVDFNRFTNHKRNIYSTDWELLDLCITYQNDSEKIIKKPVFLDKMLDIARRLSQEIPHVRIDLYLSEEQIYFGEMTFYHGAGFEKFNPEIYDYLLGSWLDLSKVSKY
jgi:hypothetical protein